ncbi:MAG: histidine kinase [Bacteroidetes bacterium]|nr:histidine kinase [Bacteroidota bacterium]
MFKRYLLILCIFCSILPLFKTARVYGQEKIRIHYKIEDGLFSNTIYSIVQDQKGFIWISTDNGVCRFDGKQFKRYSTSNGLPDNDILSIDVDQQGRIWLATFNRNLCYIFNNSIYTRNNDSNLKKLFFKSYLRLLNLNKSGLIIQEEGRPRTYKVDRNGNLKPIHRTTQFLSFDDYHIELTGGLLKLINPFDKILDSLQISNIEKSGFELFRINSHSFLLSVKNKSYKYQIQNNRIQFVGEVNFQYRTKRFVYSKNELWLYETPNRLVPMDSNLALNPERHIEFDNITINIFFIDNEGGYWIGTKGDGIYYFPKIPVDHFNSKTGLCSDNIIRSTLHGKELYVLLDNNKVQRITNNHIDSNFSIDLEGIHKGNIKTILANDDYVICGSDLGYLYLYQRSTTSLDTTIKLGGIKYLEHNDNSSIFIATSGSAIFYNLKNQTKQFVDSNRSTSIKKMNDTSLLVAGINSVKIVHFTNSDPHAIRIKKITTIPLKNTTISDIQNTDSLAVIATVESGIYLYSKGRIEHISYTNGLSDNNCKSIFIDSEKKIWVATSNGINIITLRRSIHNYDIEKISTNHGLTTNNINGIHQIGHSIFASSSKGIFRFPINYLQSEQQSPKIYITEIENYDIKLLPVNNQVTLRSDSVNLKIGFSGIDYRSMGTIRYKYRILELSKEWQTIDIQTLSIQQLSPGTYHLEILAQNSSNSWSTIPAQLQIEVKPLWWQQPLFKLVLLLGALLLIFAITKAFLQKRYQKQMEAEEMKNHITEVELKAIKAQINPHFIFNTLNAIQYFIQNEENEKADNYLNKMSRLIRTTLNFSNEASIDLAEEIAYLQTYLELETLRFDEDFTYHIENTLPNELLSF